MEQEINHSTYKWILLRKIPPLDMSNIIADELLKLEAGIDIYDSMLNDTLVAYCPLICMIGDNPRSSYKSVEEGLLK